MGVLVIVTVGVLCLGLCLSRWLFLFVCLVFSVVGVCSVFVVCSCVCVLWCLCGVCVG